MTDSFQLLVAGTEALPLAGYDGEQGVHLSLGKLALGRGGDACKKHSRPSAWLYAPVAATRAPPPPQCHLAKVAASPLVSQGW